MAWDLSFLRPAQNKDTVLARVERHMGGKCLQTHIISHAIQPLEQVNLQIVLDKWLETEPFSNLFGYSFGQYTFEQNLAHFVQTPEPVAPVEREHCHVNANGTLDCVTRGAFLVRFRDQPIVIMIRKGDG